MTDQEIQNNQESMEEQDEVEHTSTMPSLEDSEEETVNSRHEDPAEGHIKEEFVTKELQLNQEVVKEDFTEELKDHTIKPKPETLIKYTLFDSQRGQAIVLSSQKQPCKTNKYSNWVNVCRVH